MRRATIALGIIAILASSCGEGQLPKQLAATLEDRVAQIRTLAENGRPWTRPDGAPPPRRAGDLETDAGRIDDSRAAAIIDAAEAVDEQLGLVPRASPTESPSASPAGEGDAGDGEGKPDKDKDKGNGNGDEGHGNDD